MSHAIAPLFLALLLRSHAAALPVAGPWALNDWESIRDLTLSELDWHETGRGMLHGVTVINGTISVGPFSTLDSSGAPKANPSVKASCTLAVPAAPGAVTDAAVIGTPLTPNIAVHLAKLLALPNLYCEFKSDVPNFWGLRGLNMLNAMSYTAMPYHCPMRAPTPCTADELKWGNFESLLARKGAM